MRDLKVEGEPVPLPACGTAAGSDKKTLDLPMAAPTPATSSRVARRHRRCGPGSARSGP